MISEGIRVGTLHSYRDYGLEFKFRRIGLPTKKSIRETVAFFNGYYDYSALNGSPAWGERKITYGFDIIASNPAELDAEFSKVMDWLCNIQDEDIYDDDMPNFHWHGSYDTASPNWDDSGMQVEITVDFVCYPFKIENNRTMLNMTAGQYTVKNLGQAVAPIVKSDAAAAIQIGTYVTSIPANEEVKLEIDLQRGENTVIVTGEGTLEFGYYMEVM